ncbi:pilus assembly FimT family protein [Oceanisphaera ostreae]|uniref:Tfp pilus assembly protein FimT/FimU n=1 Tax=Oceanisphaera ostreae TaxID=914151 RepID=A0ABW3KCL3_9GAMM
MRRSAGFTLIELVIVMVILGILGAVAAPRFLNLQNDAYSASLKALRSNMQSALQMANVKAVLEGKEQSPTWNGTGEFTGVVFKYGYPAAAPTGILAALQGLEAGSGDDKTPSGKPYTYILDASLNTLTIRPSKKNVSDCQIVYREAVSGGTALLNMNSSGC